MNITQKKLFNKICAMLIVIALTFSDFMFVGQAAISYAVGTKTMGNVEFSAYFINNNGEKVENLEENIDKKEEYLYVDIAVKNEGYFNGKISLSNNNFNIKNMKLSEFVSEISGNEVKLNQINAGKNVTIKLAIEPISNTSITKDMLNSATKINLNGQYVNSKNVEKSKYVDIDGTVEATINWKSSENTKLELESSLLTNAVFGAEKEQNRVVQILVNSKITNNNYPVKNTNITLDVPENVKDVTVHSRSNSATNSNVKFSNANYKKENNKLTITVANEDENNISWAKNVQDSFVVTYIFDKEENVLNKEINVTGNVTTYDNKELSAKNSVHIDKEIDGIVSFELNTNEASIYKGKLYTGDEREYKTTSKIYVDYINANKISLNVNEATFITENSKMPANIIYKQVKINKNEFLKIFGNEGYIKVGNTNINVNTSADSNGYVIYNLPEGTKNVSIETSKPVAIGTLNVEFTKGILSTGYSRETVKSLTSIEETITGKYDEKQDVNANKNIELKNTTSKANMTISTNTLSSLEENKQVKITTVLENNDESKDLYQNPTIKIKLPEQVKAVNNLNSQVLYAIDNLGGTANTSVKEENGSKYIEISLSGTQNKYNTETLEGTTIITYADLLVDEFATNSDEEIIMTYTNELASSYEDNGEIKVPVKIAAEQGLIITNNIKELNINTKGNIETKDAVVEIGAEEKNLTVEIGAINNEDSDIENVEILGTFPTNSNLGTKLTSGLNISTDAKVYYSDKENATKDLNDSSNNWSLNGSAETAKSYLILVNSMKVGERFTANYTVNIPANLKYNLNATEGYTVDYKKSNSSENKTKKATTINITTGSGAEISANLKAYVGGEELKDGDTVYTGEIIRYELTLDNKGTEDAQNVNVTVKIPEGTKSIKYIKATEVNESSQEIRQEENILRGSEDYYNESDANILERKSEKLDVNKKQKMEFEVKVTDEAVGKAISPEVNIAFNGTANSETVTNKQPNKISNNVKKADVELKLMMICRTVDGIRSGISYPYILKIKNTSGKDISNLNVKINANEGFEVYNVATDESKIDFKDNSFVVESIKAGEELKYEIDVNGTTKNTQGTINVVANDMYHSYQIVEDIQLTNVSFAMKSDNEGQNVETGDKIVYNITLKNNGTDTIDNVEFSQTLSSYLDVTKITANGKELKFDTQYNPVKDDSNQEQAQEEQQNENELQESEKYKIGFQYSEPINKDETVQVIVETESNKDYVHQNNIHLSSSAEAKIRNVTVTTEEINHILKANSNNNIEKIEEEVKQEAEEAEKNSGVEQYDGKYDNAEEVTSGEGNPENSENPSTPKEDANNEKENTENNPTENNQETYTISGTAWLDENENGARDASEKTLSGIKVRLLNLDNNKSTNATTSENGFYSISNVTNGKYVAIFEYDTEKYILTKYHVEGTQETRNSDVENVNMNLDGENKKVSATNNLIVNNSNLTNIDIGLLEAKVFDLSLSKTVSSVKINNDNGTSNKEYDDANLAKVEVKAKYLNSTTAVIEYKIKVTNNGELAGYARKIADYKPADLNFNSKLNPDWYQSGEYLYSTALSNTKIEAGETKELTLVLTKTMNENNTGLTNNTAEIVETYNSLGVEDADSVPGDRKGDDYSSANVIISVSTGAAVSYVSLTLSIIAIIAVGAYIATRKILKENITL